jgi:hypothetical protein
MGRAPEQQVFLYLKLKLVGGLGYGSPKMVLGVWLPGKFPIDLDISRRRHDSKILLEKANFPRILGRPNPKNQILQYFFDCKNLGAGFNLRLSPASCAPAGKLLD